MMVKKMFVILLVVCLFSFITAPRIAFAAEGEASPDGKAVLGGLLLIALAIFALSNSSSASLDKTDKYASNKSTQLPQNSVDSDQRFDAGMSFENAGYTKNAYYEPFVEQKDEWRTPEVKVSYTW